MPKRILSFVVLFLIFTGIFYFVKKKTVSRNADPVTTVATTPKLPDDFHDFYNKFHTDSLFQMEHIIFPLEGLKKSKDSNEMIPVKWEKNEWRMHRPFNDYEGTFERSFTNMDGIITEYIRSTNGMFSLEKRYAKINGEWHLIYYRELTMEG